MAVQQEQISLSALAAKLYAARQRAEQLKNEAAKAETQHREIEAQVYSAIDTLGITSYKHPTLGTFINGEKVFCNVESPAQFNAWLDEHPEKRAELTRLEVRKSALNAWAKERLDEGDDLPPGVSFVATQYVSIRSPKNS